MINFKQSNIFYQRPFPLTQFVCDRYWRKAAKRKKRKKSQIEMCQQQPNKNKFDFPRERYFDRGDKTELCPNKESPTR